MLGSTFQQMIDAAWIRQGFGLLTHEETAEQYGVDLERIADAVRTEELGSVTLEFQEGATLSLVPTSDAAVAEWLEAQR
jgi:hypothetical protein